MVDIARPSQARKKKIRRILIGTGLLGAIVLITVGVSRLKPAAPSVDRATVWIDTVKRGSMLRQVRGSGTLVPEMIRWIPATTQGRVENILLRPGATVKPDTVILELSNPELQQSVREAQLAHQSAQAAFVNRKQELESALLSQQADVATIEASYKNAALQLDAQEKLYKDGLVSEIQLKQARSAAEELKNRLDIGQRRLAMQTAGIKSQLAPQEAEVDQRRAAYELRVRQLDDLKVKAGMNGRPAGRAGRARRAGGSGHQPRARREPDEPEGGAADRGNADEGHPHRPGRRSRHAQRHRQRARLAHRSRVCRRHGRRGRDPRGRAAVGRAARPERRRHDPARAAGQRPLRRPPGVRPGEQSTVGLFKLNADGEAGRPTSSSDAAR